MAAAYSLLFDLDGTLVDSIPFLLACARHTFRGYPGAPSDATWMAGIGTPLRTQIASLALSPRDVEPLLERYRSYWNANHDQSTRAFAGAVEMVQRLAGQGHLIAVVTSKSSQGARRTLAHIGLLDAVHEIVAADSCARAKPDPLPVLFAIERLRTVPEHALMVGDSPHDIAAGRAAGARTVAVLSGVGSREEMLAAKPDHVLASVIDLPALLDRLERKASAAPTVASRKAATTETTSTETTSTETTSTETTSTETTSTETTSTETTSTETTPLRERST